MLVDIGQFIAPNPPWLAAEPTIGLPGFGVDAVDDDLLAVAQEFEFFRALPLGAVRLTVILRNGVIVRNKIARFGGLADAHQEPAALLETLAREFLDRDGGVLVEDVEIERRRVAAEHAGVAACGPGLAHMRFAGRYIVSSPTDESAASVVLAILRAAALPNNGSGV